MVMSVAGRKWRRNNICCVRIMRWVLGQTLYTVYLRQHSQQPCKVNSAIPILHLGN